MKAAAAAAFVATLALLLGALVLPAVLSDDAAAASPTPSPTRTPTKTPTPSRTPRGLRLYTPTPTATVVPPPPAPAPAVGPGIMIADCRQATADGVRAYFLWTPSRTGTQWLDLSIFNDGFAPGTFISAGPFHRDGWGWIWEGLWQGTTHYARVNTLTSQGWMTSRTLAFYTPVCDPASLDPAPADDLLRLRANIDAAIAGSGINAAVAITDLRTGETIDVNGRDPRLPGCTINLFALARVVQDLQFGRYPEPEAGDLIGQTIHRSDPVTSRLLVKYWIGDGDLYSGVVRVNEFMQSLGMASTLMDHPPAYPHESYYGSPDNHITALDANRGLRAIWDGRVLTPGWRDYLLHKMTNVKPGLNYLIPAGVGYDATVSHKNGFLYAEGWADNDIGIVWFERGGQRYGYAISFFTEGVPTKYADIPLGQRVSALAWQWFVGRYGYP